MFKTSNLKATLCDLHKLLNGELQFFKFEQEVPKSNVNQHSKWRLKIFVEYSWSNRIGSKIKHWSTFEVEAEHLCWIFVKQYGKFKNQTLINVQSGGSISLFMKQYSGFKNQTLINIQSGRWTSLLNIHEAIYWLQISIMYQWTWKFQLPIMLTILSNKQQHTKSQVASLQSALEQSMLHCKM